MSYEVPRRILRKTDQEEINNLLDSVKNELGEIDNSKFEKKIITATSKFHEKLLKQSNEKSHGKKTKRKRRRKKTRRKKTRRKTKSRRKR